VKDMSILELDVRKNNKEKNKKEKN